ncbi:hypothetical protein D3C76_175840 [compost metagenome]
MWAVEKLEPTIWDLRNYRIVDLSKPDQYSYNPPNKSGHYVYKLTAVWEQRSSAAYYFGILIESDK